MDDDNQKRDGWKKKRKGGFGSCLKARFTSGRKIRNNDEYIKIPVDDENE
jgi:hypothetical protein